MDFTKLTWRQLYAVLAVMRVMLDNSAASQSDEQIVDGESLITASHDVRSGYGEDARILLSIQPDYFSTRDFSKQIHHDVSVKELTAWLNSKPNATKKKTASKS